MTIGILSDSHDNLKKIEKAVKFFNKKKAGFILHAGDFIAPFTIPKLKALNCDWRGVFGNNDGEKSGLSSISEGRIQEGPLRIELDNRKIILVHALESINPEKEDQEVIIFSHTHKPEIKKLGNKILINPGECGGWVSGESTVALLDLSSLSAEIFQI